MISRVIGESFGAYTTAAVEGMELDVHREYNNCGICDSGVYWRCHRRAWGGIHPAPTSVHTVVEDRPWTCTRELGHVGSHVACRDGAHEIISWRDADCLPAAACKMFTMRLLVEAAGLNIPGKFVRRPPLEQLAKSGDYPDSPFPVDREEPRPEGGVTLFIYNREACHMVGVDVTEEFAERLPILYVTEGDLLTRASREHGEKFSQCLEDSRDWNDEVYHQVLTAAEILSAMQVTPGGYPEQILNKISTNLLEYEKTHFMAG